jgi:hypothetical protein
MALAALVQEADMKTLSALVERESFEVPPFALDDFQQEVREHLFLEFFLARGRLILTPHFTHLTTDEATPSEQEKVRQILGEKQDLLEQLKVYLLRDLALYSALLETNSYLVVANEHRLICRFLHYEAGTCEVKLYTLPPGDPLERYGDRIYLGRDCLPLDSLPRPHLGLGYLRRSLPDQLDKLRLRLDRYVSAQDRLQLERDYLTELTEVLDEFAEKADVLMRSCPPVISSAAMDVPTLLRVNHDFRELKHILADAEVLAREIEEGMLATQSHAARYVTKLRKDLTNDVNSIMLKVNGRINDAVNGIHV